MKEVIQMKKIIILIVCISLLSLGGYLIYTHSFEKSYEKKSNEQKNNPLQEEQIPKSVDNFEKEVEKSNITQKIEEKEKSYTQTTEKETKPQESYEHKSNDKPSKKIVETKIEEKKQEVVSDDRIWSDFINDPETLRVLGGYITQYTTYNSAYEKVKEISSWGYRARSVEVCTELSTGVKCAYGIKAIISAGVCEDNPEMNFKWWENEKVDIISYLKSVGYKCEGKSW